MIIEISEKMNQVNPGDLECTRYNVPNSGSTDTIDAK